jgi:hypothetical protein
MSVKDIASMFEQKAKQNTTKNFSKRRMSIDNFSLTTQKFYQPTSENSKIDVIKKSKFINFNKF